MAPRTGRSDPGEVSRTPIADPDGPTPPVEPVLGEAEAQALIERFEGEGRARRLGPFWAVFATVTAVLVSLYALYATQATIPAQAYRTSFLGAVLVLTFLKFPLLRRESGGGPIRRAERLMGGVGPWDLALAAASVVVTAYPLLDYDAFVRRSVRVTETDVWMGALLILLVLEATRRTVGWILPLTAIALLAYAFYGDRVPGQYGHKGYDLDRVVGTLYISLEGIFGTPIDVAATYIVLFTIYGAVLEYSGAGRFFLDFSLALTGRRASGAGRTTTVAGFLLGTVSGSGVATTVTLGSLAWPMLRRAGYSPEAGGAVLSAGGIGAILSPPTLGAAAFLIAELLHISYLEVLKMATIPTILYYLCIFLMIELDARRHGTREGTIDVPPVWTLLRRYGYHFSSLIAIVALMIYGFTPILAVFWATVLAWALSFLRRETALTPRRSMRALEAGTNGTLSVAATTAVAGIIVGVFTLTGLGLTMSDLIVDLAGGRLFLTVVFTALAVWVLGLAVPVTASYIIAAAVTAPALIDRGVPDVAAHMFIFYYAVLSEVSPPTALSPFAAAAITGGNPFKTMLVTWKYTLPAFIVPFMFTLDRDSGTELLAIGDLGGILLATTTAALAIVALVAGVGGQLLREANLVERALLLPAAGLLFYTGAMQDLLGLALLAAAIGIHLLRVRAPRMLAPT